MSRCARHSFVVARTSAYGKNFFFLELQFNGSEPLECGGAHIGISAGVEYLEGKFADTRKNRQEEWFYLPDVPLTDPPRVGTVTPFSDVPPVKRYLWRPRSTAQSDTPVVDALTQKTSQLCGEGSDANQRHDLIAQLWYPATARPDPPDVGIQRS